MSKIYFLLCFPMCIFQSTAEADDMTLMKDEEIAGLIKEYFQPDPEVWGSFGQRKVISIVDMYGNKVREAEVNHDFPEKEPLILKAFLDKSSFLIQVDETYYYLYESSAHRKKILMDGNFFHELII